MTDAVDICERACDALRDAGMADVRGTRMNALSGKDGLVVRQMPPVTLARYMDGTRRVELRVQVVSKRLDPVEAMSDCERAASALQDADLSSANGSFELVGAPEVDGDTEQLALDADLRHVFAVRLACQATRQ